ncbi:MAG: HAD-IA family hydrolase [Acidobacteriota bacterium]
MLLDILGTVVIEPYPQRQMEHFGLPLEKLQELKDIEAWILFELGEIEEQEYYSRFFLDRRKIDGAALKRAMVGTVEWVSGMDLLLPRLAQRFPIYALSNFPPWYHQIEDQLLLSRYLRWSFVSCDTGLRKPDPRAYLGATRALGVAPQACLFIDDREINCEAASALGMETILFRDSHQLEEALARRGLLGAD